MMDFAPAALFTLFMWWFSTGVLLYLDHLPRQTFPVSLSVLTGLSLVATAALYALSHHTTIAATYGAFTCALVIWAWHELTFLMGVVTGPRKAPCPPDATGWRRFRYATEIVIHHELALVATAVVLVAINWDLPNQVGPATFLVLWVMRISAKLNVFLGVCNLTYEFVPEHLAYMQSYFRRARLNPLMPVSVVAGTLGVVWMGGIALAADATPFITAAFALVATTLALAVLEHIFLVVPVPDAILWRWARPGPS